MFFYREEHIFAISLTEILLMGCTHPTGYAKIGTQTILAESSGFPNVVKHGPIDSNGTIDTDLSTVVAR